MHSSTSNFEQRPIPQLPWRQMGLMAAVIVLVAAVAWELRVRAWGYGPQFNDTPDLWAEWRSAVKPDSLVIIGDSRAWFDLDLDELERGFGQRPIQLALKGSCAYPVLADLANDESFRGTVICSLVPAMFLAPGGPLVENSERAIKRYHNWTPAQKIGHYLGLPLEQRLAMLNHDDLTLGQLLNEIDIPNRPQAQVPPRLPPYFCHNDRERRARLIPQAESGELRDRIRSRWLPLFTPPPPPSYVPKEVFMAQMNQAVQQRIKDTIDAVAKLQRRGGRLVFVRFPVTGALKQHEDKMTPRAQTWDGFVTATGAPGIHFEDFPELASFDCPEWSHLTAADSVEFTKRLVPHLLRVLSPASSPAAAASSSSD